MTTATATKTSLKNFIALIPSRSVRQMVANFSGVEFLKTACIEVQEKKKKVVVSFSRPLRKLGISRRSRTVTALRNVQKSVMHVQSCCFANLYLSLFTILVAFAVVVTKAPY